MLSHRTKLADGRFMLVTRSVDFPGAPVHPKCVRMESGLAGLICGPGAKGGCEVFQIMDGDLKGNIPSAVRNFGAALCARARTLADADALGLFDCNSAQQNASQFHRRPQQKGLCASTPRPPGGPAASRRRARRCERHDRADRARTQRHR